MSLAAFVNERVSIWRQRHTADVKSEDTAPQLDQMPPDTRRLLRNRRYCLILSQGSELPLDDLSAAFAWKALQHEMALVPEGGVLLSTEVATAGNRHHSILKGGGVPTPVKMHYLDRCCVSNGDYAKFVQAGGYREPAYWPEAILPTILQFVDSTGHPGPRYWAAGAPPAHQLDHPVVGVCWYEANAYAAWVGKRLPTSEQWQRAASWAKGHGQAAEPKYPWGNVFDPGKANIWASRCGETVPVTAFADGSTPSGVRQLIGNVWEWVDTVYQPTVAEGHPVQFDEPLGEVRGGAFDTYFRSQATCQFRTGRSLFYRGHNVGFRCCIAADALPPAADSPPNIESLPE